MDRKVQKVQNAPHNPKPHARQTDEIMHRKTTH
jgi:hypothetical protein